MPEYTFTCESCSDFTTVFVHKFGDLIVPECHGKIMDRDFQTDMPRVHGDSYHKAIHSDALAIHPDQRKEHERLYPDIKVDEKNRPVFDNFKAHDKYLEDTGFIKNRAPGKQKSVRA